MEELDGLLSDLEWIAKDYASSDSFDSDDDFPRDYNYGKISEFENEKDKEKEEKIFSKIISIKFYLLF